MSKYVVMHNSADCIGCKACEVQCRSLHSGGPGAFFCRVVSVEQTEPKHTLDFVYASCVHCENPLCVKVCRTGAMCRRPDGIVYVDDSLCVGCKACIKACPWAAPKWNELTGKVGKCDLCRDRIDQGLKPACVTTCAMSCLNFYTSDALSQEKKQEYAEQIKRSRLLCR